MMFRKFLIAGFVLIFSSGKAGSVETVRKIELYIIPVTTLFRFQVPPQKVKKYATLKLTLTESAGKVEMDDFLGLILKLDPKKTTEIADDYRIVCVVHKVFGREVLYMNQFGDFLYKGQTYKNEQIGQFVFSHLPEYCK